MNGPHSRRKTEGEQDRSNFGNDFVRAKEAFRELLGWTSGAEEFSFDKDLLSNLEVRSRNSASIGRTLITLLGFRHLGAEHSMEVVKVHDKVLSAGGSEVKFGVNGDVQMVSFVGKEGRNTSGGTFGVVVSEFGKGKENASCPVDSYSRNGDTAQESG